MVAAQLSAPVAPKAAPALASNVPVPADVGFGFRGEYRLRKTDEFSSVFAFRRSHRSEHFELFYHLRAEGGTRLGLVVGKKQVPTAVGRNLIKRLARESFRHVRPLLPPCDLVMRVRTRVHGCGRQALREEMDRLFLKLRQS
ncbi:MAG: ribonuclease P protein component [Pseudomonadota bacterium]